MLRITEISGKDMRTSEWSGGTTTEIFIWPEGSDYKRRDFILRASTAKVELDESDFTSLPDYDRVIASIEGAMELTHSPESGGETAVVTPRKSVHRFDGGVPTHCVGRARDLNLMLRKGKAEGDIRFLERGEKVLLPLAPNEFALVYDFESGAARLARTDEEDFLVFMADGPSALFTARVNEDALE